MPPRQRRPQLLLPSPEEYINRIANLSLTNNSIEEPELAESESAEPELTEDDDIEQIPRSPPRESHVAELEVLGTWVEGSQSAVQFGERMARLDQINGMMAAPESGDLSPNAPPAPESQDPFVGETETAEGRAARRRGKQRVANTNDEGEQSEFPSAMDSTFDSPLEAAQHMMRQWGWSEGEPLGSTMLGSLEPTRMAAKHRGNDGIGFTISRRQRDYANRKQVNLKRPMIFCPSEAARDANPRIQAAMDAAVEAGEFRMLPMAIRGLPAGATGFRLFATEQLLLHTIARLGRITASREGR
ncbi:hypothetical protein LTR10_008621 [Elasticomyces elasticus]|nr:hypothetical protein LTR10_008621 [Elasticomyces elasticus]